MTTINGNGSAAAAAAAAAAARARAEAEARRRAAAEAARKAAEAARKAAAEAAKKAAAQAAKAAAAKKAAEAAKAAAAKKAAEAKKADPKKDPAAAKKAQEEAKKAHQEAVASQKAAEAAQKAAEAAKAEAAKAAQVAQKATVEANEAAKAEGKPEPFPLRNELQKTGFESANGGDASAKLGGASGPSKKELQSQLDANSDYERLAQKPETRQALDKLGIKDGSGLKDLGEKLARSADGDAARDAATTKLEEARKGTEPKALADIIQAAGKAAGGEAGKVVDQKFAEAVAGGKSPREAALAQKADAIPEETKKGLEKLGVKPEEYAGASKKAQEHLAAAGEAALKDKPEEALSHLSDVASEGSRALAEKGLAALAEQAKPGLGRELLKDPNVAKQVLDDKGTNAALGKILGGDPKAKLEGLKDLTRNDALRDTALKAAGKDADIQASLKKAGLEAKDLETLGKGAEGVLDAVGQLEAGQSDKALTSLRDALKANPELSKGEVARKLFSKVAAGAEGVAKDLLSDPKVREKVLEGGAAALDAVAKLANGETQLAGLADLAKNEKLRDVVANVAGKAQAVKDALAKVGLEPKDLLHAKDALPSLLDAAQKVGNKDFGGALDSVRDALQKSGPLGEKLLEGLAKQLPEGMGVGKSILKDPAVIQELIHNDEAFESAKKLLQDGKQLEGVAGLLKNESLRNAVIDAAAKDETLKAKLDKVGLTAEDLKQAGAAAPHLVEAGRALLEGNDWKKALDELGQAGGAAPDLLNKLGQKIYEKLPAGVQEKLSNLGITQEHLKEAGAALPHLVNAGEAFAAGKPEEALKELGQALQGSPEIVSTMLNKVGEKLKPGLLRDVLTDQNLVKELVSNKELHSSIGQLLSGTPEGIKEGLRGISANAPAMTAIAESLWKNEGLRTKLEKIGFESAEDLADAGSALDDIMTLKESIENKDFGQAIESFGGVINDLPDGLKDRIADKLTKTMKLPPGLADVVLQGGEALSDPEVRKNLGEAVNAFTKGDVPGFIEALGATGETLATNHPDAAVGFLDLMSKLPGSVGRFFGDHTLNEGLVKSGSIAEVFQATQKLASGDITGALGDVMQAVGKVIGYGENYKLEVPVWPHKPSVTLPFGQEGLELMGKLAKQFVSALPDSVRTTIEKKIAEVVAKAGGAAIPGGSIISAIGDGKDLYDEFNKDPKDWTSIALKGSEVALDIAGTFGLGPLVAPLRTVVGTIDTLHDVSNMIEDVNSFGKEFAFG
ncbi:globin family protein [Archangium lipolyticum]|uniref:hypothetical protein n=1 Tax=Archangium lipolyticum TaxID=2970465 RepID=UPI002149D9A6|nr:hypothetical protein [Archangium lipolyticum]